MNEQWNNLDLIPGVKARKGLNQAFVYQTLQNLDLKLTKTVTYTLAHRVYGEARQAISQTLIQ